MNPPDSLSTDINPLLDLCPACQHPRLSHDPIGLRWCAATQLGVGRRECICSGVLAPARVLTHY